MGLDQRVAVVTGAGVGIGAAIARRFIADGAKVVIAELDEAAGAAIALDLGPSALFCRTDMSSVEDAEAAVEAAVAAFGRIDILVNNAWGGGSMSRVETKTAAQLAHGLDLGFLGPLRAMVAAHAHMAPAGYGRIVNMCSLNGVNAHMGTLEYNAAKEALRSATRTAAREWAPTGIVVNAVCPAAKSASFDAVMSAHPELVAAADSANPMGRIGDCDQDIAPVVAFLASDECRYMTGNTLFVDGGTHINGSSWAPDLG